MFSKFFRRKLSSIANHDLGIKSVSFSCEGNKNNTLSSNVIENLSKDLKSLSKDDSLRVLILKSDGKLFSPGFDLAQLIKLNRDEKRIFLDLNHNLFTEMINFPVPIIASVQGPAFAAGCQLVSQSHLSIGCHEKSSFSVSGIKLGLFCSTPSVPLIHSIGMRRASHMLFTGCIIKAEEAYEYGLLTKVARKDLQMETLNYAESIAKNSLSAIKFGRRLIDKFTSHHLIESHRIASEEMLKNMLTNDFTVGVDHFLAKNTSPIKWTDK